MYIGKDTVGKALLQVLWPLSIYKCASFLVEPVTMVSLLMKKQHFRDIYFRVFTFDKIPEFHLHKI